MTVPSALIAEVRDWTGDAYPADDDAVTVQLVRFDDDPKQAALALLRRLLADLESGFSSFSTDGDATWARRQDQVDAVRAKVARLEQLCGETPTGRQAITSTPILGPEARPALCWPGTERARLGW